MCVFPSSFIEIDEEARENGTKIERPPKITPRLSFRFRKKQEEERKMKKNEKERDTNLEGVELALNDTLELHFRQIIRGMKTQQFLVAKAYRVKQGLAGVVEQGVFVRFEFALNLPFTIVNERVKPWNEKVETHDNGREVQIICSCCNGEKNNICRLCRYHFKPRLKTLTRHKASDVGSRRLAHYRALLRVHQNLELKGEKDVALFLPS